MATNFYKKNGSYYVEGTNKKVSNIAELQSLSKAGGREVQAPATTTSETSNSSGAMATLYGPNGQKQLVPVGSELAKALQSQGWGLTAGSYKMVGETETPETDADKVSRDNAYKYIESSAFDDSTKTLLKQIADQQYKSNKVQYTPEELDKIISDATLTATQDVDPYYTLTTGQTIQDLQNKMADIRNMSARYTQQEQKTYAEKLEDTRSKLRASGLTFSGVNRKTLGAEGSMASEGVEGSVPMQRRYDVEDTLAGIQEKARDAGIAAERKLGSAGLSNVQGSFGSISNPYGSGITYDAGGTKNLYEANKQGTSNYVTSGTIPLERLKAIEEAKNAKVKALYLLNMANSIFRVGKDIYDATTGAKIANPQVLATQYKGATEVGNPSSTPVNTATANSTPPTVVRPGQYGLSDWRSYQAVKDAANEIIKIRTSGNKDITDPTTYWKQKIKTGGEITPAMRELSPADQASIRMSQQAMAGGALDALDTERQYREKTAGSTIANLKDIYESQRQSKRDEDDKAYRDAMLSIDRYNAGMGDPYNTTPKGPVETDIDSFANALSGQESGGNYDAKNSRTGAAGKFQILPSNWPSWSSAYARDVLNKSMRELPNTPENQDSVAKYKMQEYYNKYGNWEDVASMWYSGKPLSQVRKEGWADKKMGNGKEPSVNEYVASVMGRLKPTTPTGKKNNNLSQDEMRALAVKTGIDIAMIPQLTNQEVINATRKASEIKGTTAPENFADSIEGQKVGTIDGLNRDELILLFSLISGGLTQAERDQLIKLGISQRTIDSATKVATPSALNDYGEALWRR